MAISDIFERDAFWKYEIFAMCFYKSKTPYRPLKIDKIINGYINLYDAFTQKIVEVFETPKRDIYEVLRWMFFNYNTIVRRDNWSIFNKRIRLSESQISPIVRLITNKIRRVLNAKAKQLNHKKYGEILTLPYKERSSKNVKNQRELPNGYLIKAIVNSSSTKYADAVNDMDIFNIFTKFTLTSPSTTASAKPRSNSLSLDRRASSISHVGIISLNTTGAGDPGATGCFTPFTRLYNGYFKPLRGSVDESESLDMIDSLSYDDLEPLPKHDIISIPGFEKTPRVEQSLTLEEELPINHMIGKKYSTTMYNDDGSFNDADDELDFTDEDFETDKEYADVLKNVNHINARNSKQSIDGASFDNLQLYHTMVKDLFGITDEEEDALIRELELKEYSTTMYNADGSFNDADDELDFTDEDFETDEEYADMLARTSETPIDNN
jgi:hypothetical protein